MSNVNILFTSAGRRVSLVRLFREALEGLGCRGRLIVADANGTAAARYVADSYAAVPRVSDPGYVDRLIQICREDRVRLLVPLIDSELLAVSERRDEFVAVGTLPLVCSPEVNRICIDKRLTHDFFRRSGIPTPSLIDPDARDQKANYPFLLKPARGSASVGVTRIENSRQLDFFRHHVPDAIVQELIVGKEYTLDILADLAGRVRCVVPRLRIETRAGEISKGVTVKDAQLMEAGRQVAERLPGVLGCVTAQCFRTADGSLYFIEVNPRFGGGFPLSARAGADFPRWLIEMARGTDPRIDPEGWTDGLAMLRYDEAVFVPPTAAGPALPV